MTTPCPNNVWNHTDGCACVANGSVTAECAEVDLAAPAAPQIVLPDEYVPSATPVPDTTRHVHDLGNDKVVVTYISSDGAGDVTDPGEKMDAVRGLLVDYSGAEAVFTPDEYSADALINHLDGRIVGDHIAFIRMEDGQAIVEQHPGSYDHHVFRELAGRYDAAVVIDRNEMHRHMGRDGLAYDQVATEINDWTGATYTVHHDVVDLNSAMVLASDADDYDGAITTLDDAVARAESAHWDVEHRVEDFYDPEGDDDNDDDDDDEFDDWGYGQDLEDEDED